MFKFLKTNKKELSISDNIKLYNQRGANNLHVNLYINDQILFQILPSKNFAEDGLKYEFGDLTIVHFFNQEKTYTHRTWKKFQNEKMENQLYYFEKPTGVHFYLKNIKRNDKNLQTEIELSMELYKEDIMDRKITVEYVDY